MKATPNDCFHLTVEMLREIHAEAIKQFRGAEGVRDLALLESAVAAPQASFGGQSPYADIPEVAAAYLFYLCQNHPFVDGNKRAALGACLVFLRLNDLEPPADGQSEFLPRRAVGLRRKVIQAHENEARTERGAFVAIHERVILAEIK